DEEGGGSNGVRWLIANHKELIDAAYALNEGGGGSLPGGQPFIDRLCAARLEPVYQLERGRGEGVGHLHGLDVESRWPLVGPARRQRDLPARRSVDQHREVSVPGDVERSTQGGTHYDRGHE